MKPISNEILELLNKKDNSNKEDFNKKLQLITSDMQLKLIKCDLDFLPEFVRLSNSRLYKGELKNVGIDTDQDIHSAQDQYFKNIYKIECKDNSSFYVMYGVGVCVRTVSDHWTEESILVAAKIAGIRGGQHYMIPCGEPGAFPAHLRQFAMQAYANNGVRITDPTPPTYEMIEASRKTYERPKNEGIEPQIMPSFKDKLSKIKQPVEISDKNIKAEEKQVSCSISPFNIDSRPGY